MNRFLKGDVNGYKVQIKRRKVEVVQLNERICPICGELFQPKHPDQKYCKLSKEKKCKLIGEKNSIRDRVRKHRSKKNRERREAIKKAYQIHGPLMDQYHCGKGTTDISPIPEKDMEKEKIVILNEFKELKLELTPHLKEINSTI